MGNVCRSPLAAARLAHHLAERQASGVLVTSAGVGALVGHPMDAHAAAALGRLGSSPDGFTARQLDATEVESSDLVLTATTAVRSRVLAEAPRAMRRTFTIPEFALLIGEIHEVPAGIRALVAACAGQRGRLSAQELDVPDPIGKSAEVHHAVADQIERHVRVIANAIAQSGLRPAPVSLASDGRDE